MHDALPIPGPMTLDSVLTAARVLPGRDQIDPCDGWLRSKSGEYLLLRGLCFGPSAKLHPYLPFRGRGDWDRFESFIDLLLASGFTTLRLPFLWSAFEPTCNPDRAEYDEQYFNEFFYFAERFTEKGFLLFIDLHQDLVGKAFGGNGLPEWVMANGAKPKKLFQNTSLWGLNYVLNKGLRRTFTEFWQNDLTNDESTPPLRHFRVRDRFLDTIERIAEASEKNERILGIEIFNEPHPALLNHREFEEKLLPEFYGEAVRRIRKHSDTLYAFLSPQSDWNVNVRSDKRYRSYLAAVEHDPRVIFAYHYYDSLLTGLNGRHFHEAKRDEYLEAQQLGVEQAREKSMIPFLTEFGTRQNWRNSIVRQHMDWQFEAVEQALVNATYWNVNLYNTERDRDGFMREDFSLIDHNHRTRNLDIAVRPYVLRSTARPVYMHFNSHTSEFELTLHSEPAADRVEAVAGEVSIYLPAEALHPLQPVHFPKGFDLYTEDRIQASYAENLLVIRLDPERTVHNIRISSPSVIRDRDSAPALSVRL